MLSSSGRIKLRAPEPSDAQLIYNWENDPQVWRAGDTLIPYSMYQIEEFILNASDLYSNKQLRLMIDFAKAKPIRTVGAVDLYDFDPRHNRAGVGIMINSADRGNGIAGEALDVFEDYVFTIINLHQLYCFVNEDNEASISLFRKRGYEQTGIRKHWVNQGDKWLNQLQFQKINPKHLLINS